jgi:tetratricopeptide (TPR) repeat protein
VQADDRFAQALALRTVGHALNALARLGEALEAFQRALDLWQQLAHWGGAMVCLAGMGRISLAQGDLAAAQAHVEKILSYLKTGSRDGTEEPVRVYLTCYRVLQASGDPRADSILEEAHALLQERAATISDERERRSYLENVVEHREIVEEYAERRRDMTGNSEVFP